MNPPLGPLMPMRALAIATFWAFAGCAEHTPEAPLAAIETGAVAASVPAEPSASEPASEATTARSVPTASVTASVTASAASATSTASADLPPAPPCPSDMVLFKRACVDRYEAHLVLPKADGTFEALPYFARPPEGKPFEARNAPGVFPQAYISRTESQAACAAASKRLCSFDEWRDACRGAHHHVYPFGARTQKGACNSGKPHLLAQLFGEDRLAWKYDEHFNSPLLNQKEGYLAKSGQFEACVSEPGAFDMVGNLHEWVSGMVTNHLVARLDAEAFQRRKQPWQVGNGVFVGGFYSTSDEHGPGCLNVTIAHAPRYHDYSIGFRCCKAAVLPAIQRQKPTPPRAAQAVRPSEPKARATANPAPSGPSPVSSDPPR